MVFISTLVILPLLKVASSKFSPTLTVTCTAEPTYTFTLTDASAKGAIFIEGHCAAQPTEVSGDYTFDAAACTPGTVPALGTEFTVVVQRFSVVNTNRDYIVDIMCSLDTSSVRKVATLEVGGEEYGDTRTVSIAPTFSIVIKGEDADVAIANGIVGDDVNIVISIPANEAGIFDYQTTNLVAETDSGSVTIIDSSCTQYESILAQPSSPTGGTLTLSFPLFIPRDTATTPTLPGTGHTTVTYTFTIEVCDTACTAPICPARKRRSITPSNSTIESVEVATSLVVYPLGTDHKRQTSPMRSDAVEEEVNACLSRIPLIGVMIALSIALAVCVCVISCMFCRLRRNGLKDNILKADFTKHSYKA